MSWSGELGLQGLWWLWGDKAEMIYCDDDDEDDDIRNLFQQLSNNTNPNTKIQHPIMKTEISSNYKVSNKTQL